MSCKHVNSTFAHHRFNHQRSHVNMATLTATTPIVKRSQAVNRPVPHIRQAHARRPFNAGPRKLRGSLHSQGTAPARGVCRAGKDSQEPPWQRQEGTGAGGSTDTEKDKNEPELTPQDRKGRRTAIITGFISIGFGATGVVLMGVQFQLGSASGL